MTKGENSIEKFLLSWECFCKHSFHNPQVYHAVFIADLGSKPDELLKHYFEVFQNDLTGLSDEIRPLILEHNLSKRSRTVLEKAVKKGYIEDKDIQEISDMTILIWKGMLTTMLNNRRLEKYGVKLNLAYVRLVLWIIVLNVPSKKKRWVSPVSGCRESLDSHFYAHIFKYITALIGYNIDVMMNKEWGKDVELK